MSDTSPLPEERAATPKVWWSKLRNRLYTLGHDGPDHQWINFPDDVPEDAVELSTVDEVEFLRVQSELDEYRRLYETERAYRVRGGTPLKPNEVEWRPEDIAKEIQTEGGVL